MNIRRQAGSPAASAAAERSVAFATRLVGGRGMVISWGGRVRAVVPVTHPLQRARSVLAIPAFRQAAQLARLLAAARVTVHSVPIMATEDLPVEGWSELVGSVSNVACVAIGAPGPTQRLLAFVDPRSGLEAQVVKIAFGDRSIRGVVRERRALEDPDVVPVAPKLHAMACAEGHPALVLEAVQGRPGRGTDAEGRGLARALAPRSDAEVSALEDRVWLRRVLAAHAIDPTRVARALGAAGRIVRFHGDLAPWNVIVNGPSITIIDWEESMPDGYPGVDLAHFALACALHLRRLAPLAATAWADAFLARTDPAPTRQRRALLLLAAAWHAWRDERDGVRGHGWVEIVDALKPTLSA